MRSLILSTNRRYNCAPDCRTIARDLDFRVAIRNETFVNSHFHVHNPEYARAKRLTITRTVRTCFADPTILSGDNAAAPFNSMLDVASGSASGAEPTAWSDEPTLRGVGPSGPEAARRER